MLWHNLGPHWYIEAKSSNSSSVLPLIVAVGRWERAIQYSILCLLLTSSEVFIIFLCSSKTFSSSVSVAQMENPTTESLFWNERFFSLRNMQGQDILPGKKPCLLNIFKLPLCVSFISTNLSSLLTGCFLPFKKTLKITKGSSRSIWGALGPYELCAWLLFQPSLRPQKRNRLSIATQGAYKLMPDVYLSSCCYLKISRGQRISLWKKNKAILVHTEV